MTFGEKVKKLCEENNISQRELAEKIGITEVRMLRYIRDERIPNPLEIINISKALNTTPEYILDDVTSFPTMMIKSQTGFNLAEYAEKNKVIITLIPQINGAPPVAYVCTKFTQYPERNELGPGCYVTMVRGEEKESLDWALRKMLLPL